MSNIFWLILLLALTLSGAVTDLKVTGVTNVQAVIQYTAPTTSACTVEVSESPSYSPLVHDVNPTLFPGSQLDSRAEAVNRGLERTVVVGLRRFDVAADSERYSRALQAATLHYVRATCGADTATTTFTTRTVPLGLTRPDPVAVVNPASTTGQTWFPTRSLTDRTFSLIDPHSGVLVRNLALPGDISKATDSGFGFSSASGTNWSNPDNIRAAGGGTADYDGASCAGPTDCDWLLLSNTYTGWDTAEIIDYVTVSLTGSGSDATAANRQVELCVVFAGSSCTADSVRKIVTLPTSSGIVTAGSTNAVDNWLYSYAGAYGTGTWNSNGGFKIALRKTTNVGTISLDLAQWGDGRSLPTRTGSGGNTDRCQDFTDSNGFYFCTGFQGNGASGSVYRIHGDTGEVRYLGIIPTVSVPTEGATGCSSEYQSWDRTTAGVFYCTAHGILYRYTYTGDGTNKAIRYSGQQADWSTSPITGGATKSTINDKVATFVAANSSKYPRGFTASAWRCSSTGTLTQGHLVACTKGNQDTYGWLAVLSLDGSAAIAAFEYYYHPYGRWCSIHSSENLGDQPVYMISTQKIADGGNPGGLPYRTTLVGAINSSTTTVVVASDTPTSSGTDSTLYAMQVGDLFSVDSEWFRITGKSGTTLTVATRGTSGTGADNHSDGATVQMQCGTPPGAPFEAFTAFFPTWDFVNDPYGEDQTGNTIWINQYNGHMTARGHLAVTQPSFAVGTVGQNLYATVKRPSYNTSQSDNPNFAGVSAGNPGLTMQTHPTFHNTRETGIGRNFWLDVRPFIGGSSISRCTGDGCLVADACSPTNAIYPAAGGCAVARVSGTSNVYQVTRAGNSTSEANYPTTAKYFPLHGKEGVARMYTWVGGPGVTISDSDHYKGCWAVIANECVSGSSAGNVYVVVPSKTTYFGCRGGEVSSNDYDTCVTPQSGQLSQLIQAGAIAPQRDNTYTRNLAAIGLGMAGTRSGAQTENTKALPNGKWAMATSYIGRSDVVLVKMPPVVVDYGDRHTWRNVTAKINSVPAGTDNVLVEFGYNPSRHCHEQRSEPCIANSTTIPTGQDPYRFPVEGTGGVESGLSGVSCSSSCAVAIPAIPARVLYMAVKYRNSSNTVIATEVRPPIAIH